MVSRRLQYPQHCVIMADYSKLKFTPRNRRRYPYLNTLRKCCKYHCTRDNPGCLLGNPNCQLSGVSLSVLAMRMLRKSSISVSIRVGNCHRTMRRAGSSMCSGTGRISLYHIWDFWGHRQLDTITSRHSGSAAFQWEMRKAV